MPPRKRIFKKDILEAAIRVIRFQGADGLTVRRIAAELSSSTQPIYSEFGSLENLQEALVEYASETYLRFHSTNYKEFALSFLEFARQEKALFQFLYLRQRRHEDTLLDDVNGEATVALLAKNLEMPLAQAREMHQWMQYYCYAMGVMMATGYQSFTHQELSDKLTELYRIILRHFKKAKSEDELQDWLRRSRNLMI